MTDTNAESAGPATPRKWTSPTPPVAPQVSPAPAKVTPLASNSALTALQVIGALLFIGGSITMFIGFTRKASPGNSFLSSAADNINSAVQFAGTSTLIVLGGAVAVLLGGMALIGALTVAAVKASK